MTDEPPQKKDENPVEPTGEPLPAPLPAARNRDRPGVWVGPGRLAESEGRSMVEGRLLPPLPQPARARYHFLLYSFCALVALPTALIGIYFGLLAQDEYFVEFRFSVTQGTPVLPGNQPATVSGTSPGGALSGLAAVLGAPSTTGPATPQNFIVADYLKSPKAVEDLQQRIDVRSMYARPEIHWWQRVQAQAPLEDLVEYFHHYVDADYDEVTGLAVATVRAYTAKDALLIGETLAALAEDLINDINMRAYNDAVGSAEGEVGKAQKRMRDVDAQMYSFRAKEGVINPDNSTVSTNVALELQLQNTLVTLETQLKTQGDSNMDAFNGPTAKLLRAQISATRQQLAAVQSQVAHNTDGARALADVVGRYEELSLEQQYAQNMVVQTMQALDIARANAAAQHLYIVPYVKPSLPQKAIYPRRTLDIVLGALCCFGFWLGSLLIVRSIQDHVL
jgi:capsular polysaccharide transport system permease protein